MRPSHPVLLGGPLLIAHRGGSGLTPENTLAAFERAVSLWQSDMIELDVRATRDGECVVIHDATVDRTTNGSGAVEQFTLAELQTLDAGHRFSPDGASYPFRGKGVSIPTLEAVLRAVPQIRITIEVKTAAAQRPMFSAIERAGAEQRIVAAGELRAFRTEFARCWTGCLSACREDAMPFFILHQLHLGWLAPLRVDVVQISEYLGRRRALTPRLIRELHGRGVLVHVWTVNEVEDMHRLLDWGVDGIVTDRPDRLAAVLHERFGRPVPPGLIAS